MGQETETQRWVSNIQEDLKDKKLGGYNVHYMSIISDMWGRIKWKNLPETSIPREWDKMRKKTVLF